MSVIGVIPAIQSEKHPSYISPAMLPVDYDVVNGSRMLRPVIQIAVDGMVNAGVDSIVFVINEANLPVMNYFKDGQMIGVPISFVWAKGEGLALAVDSVYAMMRGNTVLMALPGVMDKKSLIAVLNRHYQGSQALTVSVAPNVRECEQGIQARGLQLTGVYAWSASFTEYLRERLLARPKTTFDDLINTSSVKVSIVKYTYTPLVNTTLAYTKALHMADQVPEFVPDAITTPHSEP